MTKEKKYTRLILFTPNDYINPNRVPRIPSIWEAEAASTCVCIWLLSGLVVWVVFNACGKKLLPKLPTPPLGCCSRTFLGDSPIMHFAESSPILRGEISKHNKRLYPFLLPRFLTPIK